MSFKVLIFREETGGYRSKVPALPGCATQGETIEELMENTRDAISGWLSVDDESFDLETEPAPIESRILQIPA